MAGGREEGEVPLQNSSRGKVNVKFVMGAKFIVQPDSPDGEVTLGGLGTRQDTLER